MLKIALSHRDKYGCSVLKGIATIDYQHITNEGPIVTPENADPKLGYRETVAQFICHNREECGIAYTDADGNRAYNWNACPAHKTFSDGRFLPSTTKPRTQ
jgi:hypothetical protein